jgi:hypothetical protein
VVGDPRALGVDLGVGIVVSGDQPGGDLEPDLGVDAQVDQGVQDGCRCPAETAVVEVLGECPEPGSTA